jgi:hypothetical protein
VPTFGDTAFDAALSRALASGSGPTCGSVVAASSTSLTIGGMTTPLDLVVEAWLTLGSATRQSDGHWRFDLADLGGGSVKVLLGASLTEELCNDVDDGEREIVLRTWRAVSGTLTFTAAPGTVVDTATLDTYTGELTLQDVVLEGPHGEQTTLPTTTWSGGTYGWLPG